MCAAPAKKPIETLPSGHVIAGKYRVEQVIGKGGMGVVYAAIHIELGERVAVKILAAELAGDPESLARFRNEARAAFKIHNEHVARVIDVGTVDGAPYMVLEFLDGIDLAVLMRRRGPIPYAEAVDYVIEALEGVAHAHALGIVHRDLKPSNLFLARRPDRTHVVKVLDFGISKATQPLSASANMALTSTRAVLGSPLYMSPEQLRSAKNVGTSTDIWSIGVILYELLTGVLPFNGDNLGELFAALLEQEPPLIRTLRPEVPPGLEATVHRCLQRKADRRFVSVGELAIALAMFGTPRSAGSVERIAAALGNTPVPISLAGTLDIRDTLRPPSLPIVDGAVTPPPTLNTWTEPVRARPKGRFGVVVAAATLAIVVLGGSSLALYKFVVPPPPRTVASSTAGAASSASLAAELADSGLTPSASASASTPPPIALASTSVPVGVLPRSTGTSRNVAPPPPATTTSRVTPSAAPTPMPTPHPEPTTAPTFDPFSGNRKGTNSP